MGMGSYGKTVYDIKSGILKIIPLLQSNLLP